MHTNSNNNTWLRRKLLEAVGASRRFYSAAAKTGRAKARKPEGAAGEAKRSRRARKAGGEAAMPPGTPGAPVAAAAAAPPAHAAAPAGPVLPAGSPRALTQRLRQRSFAEPHYPQHCTHRMMLQQVHAATPPFPYTQPPAAAAAAEEEEGEGGTSSGRSGSDVHPSRPLAPHGSLDSVGPASPFAAGAQRRALHSLLAAHMYSAG